MHVDYVTFHYIMLYILRYISLHYVDYVTFPYIMCIQLKFQLFFLLCFSEHCIRIFYITLFYFKLISKIHTLHYNYLKSTYHAYSSLLCFTFIISIVHKLNYLLFRLYLSLFNMLLFVYAKAPSLNSVIDLL